MADNYLERRMEDLRTGRLRAHLDRRPRAHRAVLVVAAEEDIESIVKDCRAKGWRTAFMAQSAKRWTLFAQQTGSLHYPFATNDDGSSEERVLAALQALERRWHCRVDKIDGV